MIVLALCIVVAVFFPGIILRVKSLLSGRKGPGLLQPWWNILLLFRKHPVISQTTSLIFKLAPIVYLTTLITAMLLLPFPGSRAGFSFSGDFILFAYLLALGKFFFIMGAMDTGSSFEGMGANREALYSMLAEPAFFLMFGSLALLTERYSMGDIFTGFTPSSFESVVIAVVSCYILFQLAMVENSRMPVDDPKTHLELTMIHEVMILDHSAFDLALVQIGTVLKFTLYGTLITNVLVPSSCPLICAIPLFFLVQIVFSVFVGAAESFRARRKLMRNPQFIATLSVIALVVFILCLLVVQQIIE